MKYIYLKRTFEIFGILFFFLSTDITFSQGQFSKKNLQPQNEMLKHITKTSDDELYKLAKRVNEDGLPGESDYAQILLTEAIRKNPKNIDALLEFAQLTEMQNLTSVVKLQKRFSFVYQAFLIDPNNPKVRYKFAQLLLEMSQKELFQKIYTDTVKYFPDHLETNIEKIHVLAITNPKLAIELAEKTLKNGGRIEDLLPIFLTALQKSDLEENYSKNLLTYTEKFPNRWLWYHLAMQYIKEKKYSNAEYAFEKSIELGNNIAARLELAIIQYQKLNKTQESIINLRLIIDNLKNNPFISKNIIYFVHTQLACALMISRNSTETIDELNFLSRYSFQNHNYYIAVINEFLKNGQGYLLEEPMQIAIQNDPMFAVPYNILSNIFKKQKKAKSSYDLYQKYLILSLQNQ